MESWFNGKDTPLQAALDADNLTALHAAVKAGANVNDRGRVGVTPLEYAVGHGNKETFLELLKMGADPNLRDLEKDNVQ